MDDVISIERPQEVRRSGVRSDPVWIGAEFPLGASYLGEGLCSFCVWAPHAKEVLVSLDDGTRREELLPKGGYHRAMLDGIEPGTRYAFCLDQGPPRPDPASRLQPESVHGPSAVVDSAFDWQDQAWRGLRWEDFVISEIHIGTFTRAGTFDSAVGFLGELRDIGITAIELMPVAQFPGDRNWGYDGVYPFAVQNSYGGPDGLKRFVDAAHRLGLAVILDVVYNHFGPEGNYFPEFGDYFTSSYQTPWGEAINFDGEQSDHVRRFFIENALYWQNEFHLDGIRMDAVHAIRDFSALPFIQEVVRTTKEQARRLGRPFHLIAESDLNNAQLLRPESAGGYGLDAQWSDDFHHSLHVLLTGERSGYYQDFDGARQLAKVLREGYAYTGQYSTFRKRRHGNTTWGTTGTQFVVCSQNHDQIGNRALGDRLSTLVSFDKLKLAAAAVVLSPFTPLFFMGEEYGERAPFQYFVSHTDPTLAQAVRDGRRREFAAFGWNHNVPDPCDPATFERCKLNRQLWRGQNEHSKLREFYRELLRLRRQLRLGRGPGTTPVAAEAHGESALVLHYSNEGQQTWVALNFSMEPVRVYADAECVNARLLLDSSDAHWTGKQSGNVRLALVDGRAALDLPATCAAVFSRETVDEAGLVLQA
jgi:maltooligosyltrehalose trehalohydrolase